MSRRARVVVAAASGLLMLLAAGFVYLRGGSTPVPVDEALDRFRSSTPAPTPDVTPAAGAERHLSAPVSSNGTSLVSVPAGEQPAAPTGSFARPLPPEGVYVYATTGHDHATALGGSTHTYPDQTTITVKHDGCGFTERWDVLAERWDERESCRVPDGDTLHRFTAYHEFFRQGDTRTFACEGFTYPRDAKPGDSWVSGCRTDTTTATTTLHAIGWEPVEVAGQRLETLHVRADTEVTGEQRGESHRDVWGSTTTGLVLRETSSLQSVSTQPAVGEVTYTEEYEIRLTSLEPRT